MPKARSLSTRFGGLLALLISVPALIFAAVFIQVDGMQEDTMKLLEERRESSLANVILVRVGSLITVLSMDEPEAGSSRMAELMQAQLDDLYELLDSVQENAPTDDPSRAEHQEAEGHTVKSMRDGLGTAARWLAGDDGLARKDVLASLEAVRRSGVVLSEETVEESLLASRDVKDRARTLRNVLIVAVGVLVAVSVVAWFFMKRTILKPLQDLRSGSDRLRAGDFAWRIPIVTQDEVGDLGGAFNEMADELGRSHAELEQKVEERTRELIRAARLADVGLLAAGVAHEINNPLGSIAVCGEGLLKRIESGGLPPDQEREYLETIVSEAYRARSITSRLLNLSRPDTSASGSVDVRSLFREAESLTRHILEEKHISLDLKVDDAIPPVDGNAGELLQVLINLILNARDACGLDGHIVLRARRVRGEQVWEVEDDGVGIDCEDLERVFDPFFSTKRPNAGTGLGLSLAAAIIARHGGAITVRNRDTGGVLIQVRMPVSVGARA